MRNSSQLGPPTMGDHEDAARLEAAYGSHLNDEACDDACFRHQPECDGSCRHLAGHINECNRRWAEMREGTAA